MDLRKKNNPKIYSALLNQTAPSTITSGLLTVGEEYTITTYIGGLADAVDIIDGGTGYSDALGVATTGGTGTGLTVDITQVAGVITVVTIANTGADYLVGDIITITGGGADATIEITAVLSDDFTNVGASVNESAEVFIATGTTPTDYSNGSTLDSTGLPIATVKENTLGGTLVWSIVATGQYRGTLAGAFTVTPIVSYSNAILDSRTQVFKASDDIIEINTETFAGAAADSKMNDMSLKLEVYKS